MPALLDEVQRLIRKKNFRFLLTGSSARKLKHGGANLLGGRAWLASLFPLSYSEIPDFNLTTYLNTGGLPHIYGNPEAGEELRGYVMFICGKKYRQKPWFVRWRHFQSFWI